MLVTPPPCAAYDAMRSLFLSVMALVQVVAAEERAVVWPPEGTAVVRAFAMSGGPSDRIMMDGKIHPTAKPAEGVALTEEQVRQLSAAMNVEQKMRLSMMCFEPRDAVVFYDKDGKILASVSVCFTCYGARIEPESLEKRLDYGAMAEFFASLKLEGGYDFGKRGADGYKAEYLRVLEEVRVKREKRDEEKRGK